MAKTFAAQIKDFADLTKQNMIYVATMAIQDVVMGAQTPQPSVTITGGSFEEGKIPVLTSALINSLVSGVDGAFGAPGADSYATVIAGYEIGDILKFGWTMEYAIHIELGTSEMAGRHFVGYNAALFSMFVDQRVAEVRS
jgi:hypothetical protein